MLIAVATDLTLGQGKYPVIRIVERPLDRVNGQKPRVGMRLGTVCTYMRGRDPNAKHWADVNPQPVDYATTNREVLERTLRTFPESDWPEIDAWLAQVPKPYKPGLYPIGWKREG